MKSKRQLQKENTRQKIMETAYRVYSEQGFAAATAVIAREAGLSHGTIFAHFQSLNELLECLVGNFGTAFALEIHDLAESSSNVEELLKTHLDILIRHEEFYIRLVTERSLLPEEVQYTFAETQSAVAHHFNRVLEQEIEKKIVKDVPVHMLFHTWLGLIHYYLWNKDFFSPEEPVLKRYAQDIMNTYLTLIKK
ncbi:TetR/AcrR family transcriptional regulator [Clostridium sp. Marseille-P2415]|uniref:TetR/AcrR family transcriptional regulator n=1 Tax=Clostridium sp. Marseille-P2415 TaxID=1805471 RepID=UPI00098841DF|nr:TetR/AcrR family transcriptional regulator [Clostridium sp. Marseille-P2415]